MSKYLLRVEAVNLANFVYDTQDLSTARGGGLALLNLAECVEEMLTWLTRSVVVPIRKGASIGLFELDDEGDVNADGRMQWIGTKLRGALGQHQQLRHATFMVEIARLDSDPAAYSRVSEELIAVCRFRQQRSPTLAFPSRLSGSIRGDGQAIVQCDVDGVRAGGAQSGRLWVSDSVNSRREYGRKEKVRRFRSLVGDSDVKVTNDLERLADDPSRRTLNGKMAILYTDGNNFGSAISEAIGRSRDPAREEARLDQRLRGWGEEFLKKLFSDEIEPNRAAWTNGNEIRIELLLWGGDEFLLVVPAWQGWRTLTKFFSVAGETDRKLGDSPVSYSAGIVFCHRNAPIQRIIGVAHGIVDLVKGSDRTRNRFGYEIFESFDTAGMDLEAYRKKRWPRNFAPGDSLPFASNLSDLEESFRKLREVLPRRRIFRASRLVLDGRPQAEVAEQTLEGLSDRNGAEHELTNIGKALRVSPRAAWLHVANLWDYVGVVKKDGTP